MTTYTVEYLTSQGRTGQQAFSSMTARNAYATGLAMSGLQIVREDVEDEPEAEGCLYCGQVIAHQDAAPYCSDICSINAERG